MVPMGKSPVNAIAVTMARAAAALTPFDTGQ
jgi:hypothetical protein